MCGGSKGPSAIELAAQSTAAKASADAETAKIKAAADLEKQKQAQQVLSDNILTANADAARRSRNRTLLAGLAGEESTLTNPLLAPLDDTLGANGLPKRSTKKAARASTLISGIA